LQVQAMVGSGGTRGKTVSRIADLDCLVAVLIARANPSYRFGLGPDVRDEALHPDRLALSLLVVIPYAQAINTDARQFKRETRRWIWSQQRYTPGREVRNLGTGGQVGSLA
jgi:hypothetical protein